MQPRKRFTRILKFLGKLLIGILLLLLLLFLSLHIPAVQKQISVRISTYLSTRLGSKVEVDRITFSFFGDLSIRDIEIWDPGNASILGVEHILLKASWLDLLRGRYLFDEVRIEGMTGRLVEDNHGFNIQFIIDAFQSEEKGDSAIVPVTLDFKKVILEKIRFEFVSLVSEFSFKANLEKFEAGNVEYGSVLNLIKAGDVIFENGIVEIVVKSKPDSDLQQGRRDPEDNFAPDFGMGIGFDIRGLDIRNGSFSFHEDTILTTPKFDAAHLDLREIQLSVRNVLINEDTLSASLNQSRVLFPGMAPVDIKGEIGINREAIQLKDVHVVSGNNTLTASLRPRFATRESEFEVDVDAQAKIHLPDFAYFLDDDWMKTLKAYPDIELEVMNNYELGRGNVINLLLKTPDSELQAAGVLNQVWDMDRISWKNMVITSSLGNDVLTSLQPMMGEYVFPPSMRVQVNTTGNMDEMLVDGTLSSTYGLLGAIGIIRPRQEELGIDLKVEGKQFQPGQLLDLSWLGPIDISAQVSGTIGDQQDLAIKGTVQSIRLWDQEINDIAVDGRIQHDSISGLIGIKDPIYPLVADVAMSIEEPMHIITTATLDNVNLAGLLRADSSIYISGNLSSDVTIGETSMAAIVKGDSVMIRNAYGKYFLDTLKADAYVSDDSSRIHYTADGDEGNVTANFNLEELPLILDSKVAKIMNARSVYSFPQGNRELTFDFNLQQPGPLLLTGLPVNRFEGIQLRGLYNESQNTFSIEGSSGMLEAYETSMDSIQFLIQGEGEVVSSKIDAWNLVYDSIALGALAFDVTTAGDTALSTIRLTRDTLTLIDLEASIIPGDSMITIIPDKLSAYENRYDLSPDTRVYIRDGNVEWDQFVLTRNDMQLMLNGDMNALEANFSNLDLTSLNLILFPDSAVIDKGKLTGQVSYIDNNRLTVEARIDSLILYGSIPVTVTMSADNQGDEVPFHFLLSSEDNTVDVKGKYYMASEKVDANLILDVQHLEMFAFLLAGTLDELKGKATGEAHITGTLKEPQVNGKIRLTDVDIMTTNPKLAFTIKDDEIQVENSKVLFNDLVLYDRQKNELTIDGSVEAKSSGKYNYDLQFFTDGFTVINVPYSSGDQIRGLLMVSTDMKIKGDEKDTEVSGDLTVLDTTNLVYVYRSDQDDLLQTEGIVEFVDPAHFGDTTIIDEGNTLYDSLVSSLPKFILDSRLIIQQDVKLRIVTNEQSGDYLETTGGTTLELDNDRTGQMRISGTYSVKKGVYRVSFYDLVKKNFNIVEGSTVKWSDTPESGELNVLAVDTVRSISIGLVGDEVSESEKSTYRQPLSYIVGISIQGTLESPVVTFKLDLPEQDKLSYPVLAKKLDRLRSPEFQSELNKQIFGLLVFGGFLPESSESEINSNQIATTALYNSVNSILASQLNRFAGQYIKGVNIDVGIQSYSDFSSPDSKQQTIMDVRVSKSILNDRLSFEVGGDFDISSDQSGANTGDNYRGDAAIIYDLTGEGDKLLKLFNNETYDIIYQEIRNTGISLVFIREFDKGDKRVKKKK